MSTDIANLVCKNLDTTLDILACRYNLSYTRYVDDITFSGNSIPKELQEKIKNIIYRMGFILNKNKESLCGPHKAHIVTGLSVTSPPT